ncbi:hypothetical protein J437_LFUL015038 [Ladona fulva]|uniref:Uncharacterized protein n=1 Tax=Ladona fulva TaxID=123851 RepID=A0A8K0P888_LADFU|nr:hypothetical protein J437_LFUL015038 [Ladona fulva]
MISTVGFVAVVWGFLGNHKNKSYVELLRLVNNYDKRGSRSMHQRVAMTIGVRAKQYTEKQDFDSSLLRRD